MNKDTIQPMSFVDESVVNGEGKPGKECAPADYVYVKEVLL